MTPCKIRFRMIKTPARADVLALLTEARAEAKSVGASSVAVVFVARDGTVSFRWAGLEEPALLGGLKIVSDKLSRTLCP